MWDKGKILVETDYQPNDEYNNIQNGCHKILEISWEMGLIVLALNMVTKQ